MNSWQPSWTIPNSLFTGKFKRKQKLFVKEVSFIQCLSRGGFWGGVHRGAHPCWPWSTGVQGGGVQKLSITTGCIKKTFTVGKSLLMRSMRSMLLIKYCNSE